MLPPVEQYLIQKEKRLFKGFEEYNDITRFVFDLETTSLEPKDGRIFMIGMKTNRGFHEVIECATPEQEREGLIKFFDTIDFLKPSIIGGYNSFNFDWYWIFERSKALGLDIKKICKSLNPQRTITQKEQMLKLANEVERYPQVSIWGYNVIDILHSVRRAQAINSNIKSAGLKYITQYLEDNIDWAEIYRGKKSSAAPAPAAAAPVTSGDDVPMMGIKLIKEFEGCHLNAYPDPLSGGLPITIGWGSTRKKDGSPFKLGESITQQEADDLLISQCKSQFIPALQKIPHWNEMSDGKRGALLSFAYNLGAGFYGGDNFNTITKRLKNKEWDLVPDALYLYRNPGSNVEAGLARRRKAEGEAWKKG